MQETVEVDNNDTKVGEAIGAALAGKFRMIEPVGRGSYGQVWLVESLTDGKKNVAKVMAQEKKHRFEAEVSCLKSCDNFAIVKLVETAQSSIGPVIILEFADGGDLSKFIKAHSAAKKGDLPEEQIGMIFVQMVLALHHIHCSRMMHRDIKSANVLLQQNGLVKVSDFGFSRKFDITVSSAVADTFLGTPYYLAPELWKRQKYSKKADVFSLGVVLYELMCLRRPFVSGNMRGLMTAIVNSEYEKPPAHYSEGLRELLAAMLMADPAKRPSTNEILLRPVVQGYAAKFQQWVATTSGIPADEKAVITAQLNHQMANLTSAATTAALNHVDEELEEPETLYEGAVHIGSVKEWKPRYVVLTPTDLVVSRVKEDRRFQKLALDTVTSVAAADKTTAGEGVLVVSLNTSFTVWIKAATDEERDVWIAKINEARAEILPPAAA